MCGKESSFGIDSVEVTAEMIRAGVDEFLGFDARFDPPEIAVERIFLAMSDASVKIGASGQASGKMGCVHRPYRK
jgi:hypothetical protein